MTTWSFKIIQSLILEAEIMGESEVELSSPREAELFRYAVNKHRRLKNLGPDLTTRVRGRTVKIFKRPEIRPKLADEWAEPRDWSMSLTPEQMRNIDCPDTESRCTEGEYSRTRCIRHERLDVAFRRCQEERARVRVGKKFISIQDMLDET